MRIDNRLDQNRAASRKGVTEGHRAFRRIVYRIDVQGSGEGGKIDRLIEQVMPWTDISR